MLLLRRGDASLSLIVLLLEVVLFVGDSQSVVWQVRCRQHEGTRARQCSAGSPPIRCKFTMHIIFVRWPQIQDDEIKKVLFSIPYRCSPFVTTCARDEAGWRMHPANTIRTLRNTHDMT